MTICELPAAGAPGGRVVAKSPLRAAAGLLTAAVAAAVLSSCSGPDSPAPTPATATAPAQATAPATAPRPDDLAALEELRHLEAQALQADENMDHARLSQTVEAIRRLEFRKAENLHRRDALAESFANQAAVLRDALHRFLFVELKDLPPPQREAMLARADRGGPDVIAEAAAALADRQFHAGKKYIRATPALRPGTTDPLTQLRVRRAGNLKLLWQKALNEAFNARVRALAGQTTTAP